MILIEARWLSQEYPKAFCTFDSVQCTLYFVLDGVYVHQQSILRWFRYPMIYWIGVAFRMVATLKQQSHHGTKIHSPYPFQIKTRTHVVKSHSSVHRLPFVDIIHGFIQSHSLVVCRCVSCRGRAVPLSDPEKKHLQPFGCFAG